MTYALLVVAIAFEVVATTALKATEGFTRLGPSNHHPGRLRARLLLPLSLTLKTIPVGIVYAVWSGAGVVLIAAIGWVYYRQAIDMPGLIGIALDPCGRAGREPLLQIRRALSRRMSDLLVNIDVDDLAKAEVFYTRAFGLKVGRRFGADGG